MNICYGSIIGLLLFLLPAQLHAHSLWINCYESLSHHPGHAIISIGYGHKIPMDDLLDSPGAKVEFLKYNVTAPDMQVHEFALPKSNSEKPILAKSGLKIYPGDFGAHKLEFSTNMQKGTYQVSAVSKPDYFTLYKDHNGRKKWVVESMDMVKGKGEIIQSCLYKAMAKSYFSKEKWTAPHPLGHELELVPRTDISHLRAGDIAAFDVFFMGKPYSSTESHIVKIEAISNTFGGPDKYFLGANVFGGKAQFRFPTPGQWLVTINVKQNVSEEESLKALKGKTMQALYCASISLMVYP